MVETEHGFVSLEFDKCWPCGGGIRFRGEEWRD